MSLFTAKSSQYVNTSLRGRGTKGKEKIENHKGIKEEQENHKGIREEQKLRIGTFNVHGINCERRRRPFLKKKKSLPQHICH